MPVTVTCTCGAIYNLRDEYAGMALKCPKCGQAIHAPALGAEAPGAAPSYATASFGGPGDAVASRAAADDDAPTATGVQFAARAPGAVPSLPSVGAVPPPVPLGYAAPGFGDPGDTFGRDRFLLRQKHFAISQKYYVWDEQGRTIAFIERPAHLARNLGAVLAGFVAGLLPGGLVAALALAVTDETAQFTLFVVVAALWLATFIVVAVALSPLRHVTFYADDTRQRCLLEVTQDNKWQLPNARYTVRDPDGNVLARFRKNYLFNLIRKRWYCYAPDGSMLCIAKEDSMILALLRRFLGNVAWLIRTNFIILQGESEHVVGELNRKLTILDRYVLDMTADRAHAVDRRIALALGVMLDTGERR